MELPFLNACLNSASAGLLSLGFLAVKTKHITLHKMLMLSAVGTSTLFLISYLYYHYHHGATRYPGVGFTRILYFTILGTHTVLAVVTVPLVLNTVRLALKGNFTGHRRVARWTLPIWLYVSVTGVVIYRMLYAP